MDLGAEKMPTKIAILIAALAAAEADPRREAAEALSARKASRLEKRPSR